MPQKAVRLTSTESCSFQSNVKWVLRSISALHRYLAKATDRLNFLLGLPGHATARPPAQREIVQRQRPGRLCLA